MERLTKILRTEIKEFRKNTVLSDDWKAENLKYEKVRKFVLLELNKLPSITTKNYKLFKPLKFFSYRVKDCYIFDDCDYNCKKIGQNLWLSNQCYYAEIETITTYHSLNCMQEHIKTIHLEIHFEYYLYCKRIINEKCICIKIR
jgi:hypothetical protein